MNPLSKIFRRAATAHASHGLAVAGTLVVLGSASAGAQDPPLPERPIVTTDWLAANAQNPRLVILHVGPRAAYGNAHIPDARLAELSAISLSRVGPDSLSLEMPPDDDLRRRLEMLGISDSSVVVVYPAAAQQISQATRVLFTLDHAGLGSRSFLLSGGLPRWVAEGRPTTPDTPSFGPGSLSPLALKQRITLLDAVAARAGTQALTIVDARAANFYAGTSQNGQHRAGHIPGARSIPYTSIFTDALEARADEELKALFADAGVGGAGEVVVYCHIGQQATAVIFGARLIGIDARLFDGSFEQWSKHTELPVTRPPGGVEQQNR